MNKKERGFTLIELLVVIAIIAILSTVVMAGLNSARTKGRDAKRLSDIKQLQSALELCYDNGVGYPSITPANTIGAAGGLLLTTNCAAASIPFSTYMATLPVNPTPGGINYTYCSTNAAGACAAGNTTYRINFSLEGSSGSLVAGTAHATPSGIIQP